MINYFTAGESHGPLLTGIITGLPAGIEVSEKDINNELRRRQKGYGRGGRMKIEADKAEIISGVRNGKTTGMPVGILIKNKDWENWKSKTVEETKITVPRPGHADLPGLLKYNLDDIRPILERASARETAIRVALGAICKKALKLLDIDIISFVVNIGGIECKNIDYNYIKKNYMEIENNELRCPDNEISKKMKELIDKVREEKDSIGGIFEVVVFNPPPGLGSCNHWESKLDARLAFAVMSIQAIKGVEIGKGFNMAPLPGSRVHDEIFYSNKEGFYRKTNNAGGIEGGMTNGENIILRAVVKPVPTLMKPLKSVDIFTKEEKEAFKERADVCVVPSAGVIAENVIAIEIFNAILEKFGCDNFNEIKKRVNQYRKKIKK